MYSTARIKERHEGVMHGKDQIKGGTEEGGIVVKQREEENQGQTRQRG